MPIYEYKCQKCSHQMEALQKISAEPLIDCPKCTEPELKKMISAARFRLKGKGWYETDFKSSGQKNLASDSSDAPKKAQKPSSESAAKASNNR